MADNETNPAEDASASENTPHVVAYPERFCFEEGYYGKPIVRLQLQSQRLSENR